MSKRIKGGVRWDATWKHHNAYPGTYSKPNVDDKSLASVQTMDFFQVRNGKPQFVAKGRRIA